MILNIRLIEHFLASIEDIKIFGNFISKPEPKHDVHMLMGCYFFRVTELQHDIQIWF